MKKLLKISAFILSIFYQYWVALAVINRSVNLTTLIIWVVSIIFIYFSFPFSEKKVVSSQEQFKLSRKQLFLLILIIVFAVSLRVYFMLDTNRFHGDEYQTAFFSYNLPKLTEIDWFAVYPERGAWVSQFPITFFIIQKLFFSLFGISTQIIRFSVLPYIIAVFIFLFLTAQRLFDTKTAYLSTFILSIFAPDLYLTSLGLHFISSTAFFLATIYFFILTYQVGQKRHFSLLGISLFLCYTTYYSSFIALPIIILFSFLLLLKKRLKTAKLTSYLLTILVFAYSISPFIVYADKLDNFFTQRTGQISVFSGQWSKYNNKEKNINFYLNTAKEQTILSMNSLYKNGIGGHGGYDFGKLALFDYFTFTLFCLGLLYFIYKSAFNRTPEYIIITLIIVGAFFTGMVFTIPPPAYHRFSIAFPFVCVTIAVLFIKIFETNFQQSKMLTRAVISVYIGLLVLTNILHFNEVLDKEGFRQIFSSINNASGNLTHQKVLGKTTDDIISKQEQEYLLIENDLKNYPNNKVYISSFASYALGRIMFFRFDGKRQFITEDLNSILVSLPESSGSLIILHYPSDESVGRVRNQFPNMQIIDKYKNHLLIKT